MARKASKKVDDINSKIIEELLPKGDPSEIFGRDGIFNQLKKQRVERDIESELGYAKHSKIPKTEDNRRNGSYSKTTLDDDGYKIQIEIPHEIIKNKGCFQMTKRSKK